MPAVARARDYQHVANLAGEDVEFVARERLDVGRGFDAFDDHN